MLFFFIVVIYYLLINDFLYISCIYYYSSIFNVSVVPSVNYTETYDLKLPAHFTYINSI